MMVAIACYVLSLIAITGIYSWHVRCLQKGFDRRYDEAAEYWDGERELWRNEGIRFQDRINGMIEENRRLRSRLEKAKTALWGDKNGGW